MSSFTQEQPLRWINASQQQLQHGKKKDASVYSHVTAKYRRWMKSNRLVTQLRSSTNRLRGRQDPPQQEQISSISGKSQFGSTTQGISSWKIPSPPIMATLEEDAICVAGSQNQVASAFGPAASTATSVGLILPPALAHGNSDPFSAAMVPMTAQVTELIYLAIHRFVVFSNRAYHLSSELRKKWIAQSRTQEQQCLSDAILTHSLLASGYCAKAGMCASEQRSMYINARAHKIKAIALLRQQMASDSFQPTIETYHIITNMASVDFAMGEPESAMLHHRAVTKMVKRPEFHDTIFMKAALGDMAETNIIRALATQPNFDAEAWDVDISSTGIDENFWHDPIQLLDVMRPPLKSLFDECRRLLRLKTEPNSMDTEEKAKLLTQDSLVLERRLIFLSIYYHNLPDDGHLTPCKKILVAITHALLCFLDLIFIESMHRGYPHGLFEPYRLNVLFLVCPAFRQQPTKSTFGDHVSLFYSIRSEAILQNTNNMSDLLNKAKSALGSGASSSGQTTAQGNAGAQKEDYGDKALDTAEKKFGMSQSRETNEKITDAGRGLYEKQTGSKVSDKFSN
ncbi:hypothetical protein H2198_005042 [Neophaeococcomyces mojaviensis]|uniref:Uncharacterized protein n=1 Tax=Neophaeococcomyces mojaviensis TaxID=3383035 RepID=A0ACC3A6Y6_9EURO|nr:hypothetical protein H2198_005042 [Knufia sp. JES_112]